MGFMMQGRYVDVPWTGDYDRHIGKIVEETYKFSGEELLHEIHKQTIEAHWANLGFYRSLSTRLLWIIALQLGIIGYLSYLLYRLT